MSDKRVNPSKLETHLGYWLRCLSNFVHRSFADKLSQRDITVAQWVVLRTLYDHDRISLRALAGIVGIDNGSLSRMVERLVQRQLILRQEGNDRRSVSISLSPKSKKLVVQLSQMADQNDEEFFHSLTKAQRKELLNIVQQLLAANGWDQSIRGQDRME